MTRQLKFVSSFRLRCSRASLSQMSNLLQEILQFQRTSRDTKPIKRLSANIEALGDYAQSRTSFNSMQSTPKYSRNTIHATSTPYHLSFKPQSNHDVALKKSFSNHDNLSITNGTNSFERNPNDSLSRQESRSRQRHTTSAASSHTPQYSNSRASSVGILGSARRKSCYTTDTFQSELNNIDVKNLPPYIYQVEDTEMSGRVGYDILSNGVLSDDGELDHFGASKEILTLQRAYHSPRTTFPPASLIIRGQVPGLMTPPPLVVADIIMTSQDLVDFSWGNQLLWSISQHLDSLS